MKTASLLILTTMLFASKVSGQKGNFCYECQGLCGQGHENQNPCCSGDLSAIKKAKAFDSEKINNGYLNSTTTQTAHSKELNNLQHYVLFRLTSISTNHSILHDDRLLDRSETGRKALTGKTP